MTSPTLASFTATDGTGLWEVTSAGIRVDGELYRFTGRSFVVCAVTPGRTERSTNLIEEEDDGFGDLAALAVLQETGSLTDAALARWALGGSSVRVETDKPGGSGNRSAYHRWLAASAQARLGSLRYREDGRWIQADEIRVFGDAAHKAINAYRERWGGG